MTTRSLLNLALAGFVLCAAPLLAGENAVPATFLLMGSASSCDTAVSNLSLTPDPVWRAPGCGTCSDPACVTLGVGSPCTLTSGAGICTAPSGSCTPGMLDFKCVCAPLCGSCSDPACVGLLPGAACVQSSGASGTCASAASCVPGGSPKCACQ